MRAILLARATATSMCWGFPPPPNFGSTLATNVHNLKSPQWRTAQATSMTHSTIAAWLSRADREGTLAALLKPDLTPPERAARKWKAGNWAFRAWLNRASNAMVPLLPVLAIQACLGYTK